MRRSLKEASIGFSLLAAIAGGVGLWFWLSGFLFGKKSYPIQMRFADVAPRADDITKNINGNGGVAHDSFHFCTKQITTSYDNNIADTKR